MSNVTLPINIDFVTWTSNITIDLPDLNFPVARDENDWKSWARYTIDLNQLAGVPNPQYFDNWQDWANYFVNNVQ